ncbi:uncharacterized protein KY384_000126 [Bacidia gigantensis]|uniref:uncharacterized protein n=1 Tax=Bacidia gigantensis TaxID=2732470 RepID=UPI001D058BC0|nr:uncharacterized protein KY384_000126 [Bacidia gigantensis]KAG8526133.1 hypothetical protein KY384_000126 [Bacidia gigantensis]
MVSRTDEVPPKALEELCIVKVKPKDFGEYDDEKLALLFRKQFPSTYGTMTSNGIKNFRNSVAASGDYKEIYTKMSGENDRKVILAMKKEMDKWTQQAKAGSRYAEDRSTFEGGDFDTEASLSAKELADEALLDARLRGEPEDEENPAWFRYHHFFSKHELVNLWTQKLLMAFERFAPSTVVVELKDEECTCPNTCCKFRALAVLCIWNVLKAAPCRGYYCDLVQTIRTAEEDGGIEVPRRIHIFKSTNDETIPCQTTFDDPPMWLLHTAEKEVEDNGGF